MVLTTLTELTIDVSVWSVCKIYNMGHWLVWGTQQTDTEIIICNQQKTIDLLQKNIDSMNTRLMFIEETKSNVGETKCKVGETKCKDGGVNNKIEY